MNCKRLLILEPYFGGSHKAFISGLLHSIEADSLLLSLPARRWKMRMQLSALWARNCLQKLSRHKRHFDTVLCSTFVDVAAARSLLSTLEGWNPSTRFCTYFHENQFAYPDQFDKSDNRQFAAINFTSALASDRLAFNSQFNLHTFLAGCNQYLRKAKDMDIHSDVEEIHRKCRVIHPGVDFSKIDEIPASDSTCPVIVWNHRWEHDKNPEGFFSVLLELHRSGFDFRIIVLGQSFASEPACFKEVRTLLVGKILHFGYAPTRQEYAECLRKGTIVVSTARHEFFGIAVLEAVRAGCRPLVPDRLAYPEIFDSQYRYQEKDLFHKLKKCIDKARRLTSTESSRLTEKYSWQHVHQDYSDWLFGA